MRYELCENGYINKVFFGCHSGTCTLYEGNIPEGYNSLEEWADNANIRAYKIVDGNLVYDSERDNALQEEWANCGKREIIVAYLTSNHNGTSAQWQTFPLTLAEYSRAGTRLSVSNGKVRIGSGIKRVLISAVVSFAGDDTASDLWISKYNSSGAKTSDLMYLPDSPYGYYRSVSAPQFFCEVEEGDLISLEIYTNDASKRIAVMGNASRLTTYMTVEVLD